MKKINSNLAVFLALLLGIVVPNNGYSQTAGTLSVNVTTSFTAGSYGSNSNFVVWIENSTGTFVKTRVLYGNELDHLMQWSSKTPTMSTVDATVGATKTTNPFTYTGILWTGNDLTGTTPYNLLPDGTYNVAMELAWSSSKVLGTGRQIYSASFTKGPTTVTVTPANQTNFTSMSLTWTPAAQIVVTTSALVSSTYCTGAAVSVPFTKGAGTVYANNVWTAQLSDATGSFTTPVSIGTISGAAAGTIAATIPVGTAAGSAYRIRVVGSQPSCIGSNNGTNITIGAASPPAVTIASSATTVCAGSSVTFTPTPTNGGTPTYQWKVNGVNTTTGSTYSSSTLANGDVVSCVMTSNAACVSPLTATSNNVTMTITPSVVPAVSIAASATTVCAGTAVTFTPTPTNGGTPTYQWRVNGVNTTTGATYSNSTLANGDVVSAVMTTTATCPSSPTATSNNVTMTVNPSVTPAVSIAASSSNICSGTSVTFTPTPTNGGTPTYQWKINGVNSSTGATFTSTSLANSDVVSCVMTSTAACPSSPTATSNNVTMTVNAAVTPAVSIAASASTICAGTSVTFTPTPANGGTPTYQWKVNGVNAATGATYTSTTLNNGDIVSCVMTSTAPCPSTPTATSNPVTMTVTSSLAPTVSIAASATSICTGTSVTFTPTPTNGGTPTYQWKVNGVNASTGSTFTSTTLANGDIVSCVMTSTAACASVPTATSNPVTITVNSALTPAVSIGASASTICSGTTVTFTPTPTNGGTPTYQWKVNGVNAGTGTTYISSSLANADIVSCVMTSTLGCTTQPTATSNNVTMTVNAAVIPAVSIAASSNTICTGTSVTFTPTPTNGGTPAYQWKLNGANIGTGNTYTSTTLNNGDIVSCVMTTTAACPSTPTAISNPVTMTVNSSLSPAVSIAASSTSICTGTSVTFTPTPVNGGTPSYQWKVNGVNASTGATFSSTSLANGDIVSCVMTSTEPCASVPTANSNPVTITVNAAVTPAVSIGASASTICSGTAVTFTPSPVNGGTPTYQWKVNGVNAGTGATYTSSTLANSDVVSCVMTSSLGCTSQPTATSNNVTITVNPALVPAVSITPSANTICTGTSVTFTPVPTNGGAPTYQWKVNGGNVSTAVTYITSTLNNGDVVSCVMTTTAACPSTPTATSNPVTMIVNTSLTPAVSIAASATSICTGTSVTFTPTPTNGGTATYQWKLNGVNASTGSVFTSSSLANGDVVSCVMTSTEPCASVPTATSNSITINIVSSVTPAVTIAPTSSSVCTGSPVTFTPTPSNGGTPTYQWKVNGVNAATGSTYTSSALNNGDVISCVMTSTIGCATSPTANSNSVTITVNPNVTPSVNIAASTTTICAGSPVTFTPTPTNGGTPTYQWVLNGVNTATGPTFSSSTLNNGAIVSAVMTSTVACSTSPTATSNPVTITVNPVVTPAVSIGATASTICAGTSVTFTPTPVNGGTPTYQWKVNGMTAVTGPNFNSPILANNDVISCVMTSTAACATSPTATSNSIIMTVNPNVTPAVNIAASATPVCAGSPVTFSPTPTNGGSPTYQWKVNGVNTATGPVFTSSSLVNSDIVSCVMTSTAACLTSPTAGSNQITMIIDPFVTPEVSIVASDANICSGSTVTFTPTPVNGGTPIYQWEVNGINSATGPTFSSNLLNNGDIVSCVMTTTAACPSTPTAMSNQVTMSVSPSVTPSISIAASATSICAGSSITFTPTPTNGGTPVYNWKVNGILSGIGSTFTISTLTDGSVVSCEMTSSVPCASATIVNSNDVTINIITTVTPYISIAPSVNSICSGTTVTFTPSPVNGGTPSYQWKVNGIDASTGTTFSSSSFQNGDIVECIMTSSVACPSIPNVTSNPVTMVVNPAVTPAVNITASSNSICAGTNVIFTPFPTNGGNPAYQWKVNGADIANGSSYNSSSLNNGDIVSCVMTTTEACASAPTATSNDIIMTVLEPLMPIVNVTDLCGNSVLSTNAPGILLWSNGASTSSINVYTAGTYTVTQSVSGCLSPVGSGVAAPIIPAPVFISQNGSTLMSSAAIGNQWYEVLLGMLNGATAQTYVPVQNGNYYSVVTDNDGCIAYSDTIAVLTTGIETNSLVDNVKIYPNPSTGIIYVEMNKIGSGCVIRVVNVLGANIYEENLELPDGIIRSIDLTKYPSGLYFVDIISGKNDLKTKIIINK